MRFVIDETSWQFKNLSPEKFLVELERMLDVIELKAVQAHGVCYSEELFHRPVLGNLSFYELYSSQNPLPIPRSIQERIAIIFSKLPQWEELDDYPDCLDVQIGKNSTLESAPSVAWAHHKNQSGPLESVACLAFENIRPSGIINVDIRGVIRPIWFVSRNQNQVDFFRWIILNGTTAPNQMELLANAGFPNLNFVPGAFNGIKDMSKPYIMLLPLLVHHLSVFSDYGKTIFLGPHIDAPGKFGALGLNVSDENGGTKSKKEARKDHARIYQGKEVHFWWHSKFERDRDRIHIDPTPVREGGKITIGIFCRHLLV